jgi:3-methylfumaryl-CoA hydratase
MLFVTVRHTFLRDGAEIAVEEQDLVYRSGDAASRPPEVSFEAPDVKAPWTLPVTADPVLLFRFSALTYNAHRIHYDRAFVREEGYADLVVHGPLQALMMGELFRRTGVSLVGREYAYRLVSPMIGEQPMTVTAGEHGIETEAETLSEQGIVTAVGRLQEPR